MLVSGPRSLAASQIRQKRIPNVLRVWVVTTKSGICVLSKVDGLISEQQRNTSGFKMKIIEFDSENNEVDPESMLYQVCLINSLIALLYIWT